MRNASLLLPLVAAAALAASFRPSAQTPSVVMQLDRYSHGQFDAVVTELRTLESFDGVLEELRRGGAAWVDAGPVDARARRRLAAATFALEAARAAEHVDWKWVRRLTAQNEVPEGADRIFWKAPPLLIEWGCALLRQEPAPPPGERIWHMASVAVAQRAGDFEFLIGSPIDERMNPADEITHLWHAQDRTPREPRLRLASAIAFEWLTWPARRESSSVPHQAHAIRYLTDLIRDEAVGAEAAVRLGAIHVRAGRLKDALSLFERAESMTRDRYLIYLARYFKGRGLERGGRLKEAEAAYRGALQTIPQSQSATLALAALLGTQGRWADAELLIEAQLSSRPPPADPWNGYAAADDRFWPELIARLRAEIHR
jgi:tetratricopeptide (TPR) repeat protein